MTADLVHSHSSSWVVVGWYAVGVVGAMLVRWMRWLTKNKGQTWLSYWPQAGPANVMAAVTALLVCFIWTEGYLQVVFDWAVGWAAESTGLQFPRLAVNPLTSVAAGAAVDLGGKGGWNLLVNRFKRRRDGQTAA